MTLLTRPALEALAQAAVQAPSADNRHTFRLKVGADRLVIAGADEYEHAPLPRRILHLLSFGAVAENVAVRAQAMGLKATVVIFPEGPQASVVAEVHLMQGGGGLGTDLAGAIPLRHTNRRLFYRGPHLTEGERAQLEKEARRVPGVDLMWLDEPSVRREALRLVASAETARFSLQALHEELFSSIRFEAGWRNTVAVGLPPGALGIELPMRPLFRGLRHWQVMRILNYFGAARLAGQRAAYWPCFFAPHLGVLATARPLAEGAFAVGQALERLWLRATVLGLALQPLAASTLYALEEDERIPPGLRASLQAGWRALIPLDRPLMVFRLGRARPPRIRSGRLPASRYLRRNGSEAESVGILSNGEDLCRPTDL
ncbi:hypothetical protein [Pelomicrobium sp.]|jgi:nitroreductase|uniref:hypothetical protein n=1 Tax=Pelomicrobium sp. TaxID=2815319 RepID=UPI002FDD6F0A